MSTVSIVKCDNYNIGKVKKAVQQSIEYLGGMSYFVKPGDKVLLKVNLLIKRKPEMATTTHPAIVQALAELVIEAGGKPIIGDSPGGYHFYTRNTLEAVYETCGMREAAEKSGAELNFNTESVDVSYPGGRIIKNIKTIKPVLEADKIISVPKIKTHMMTVYSGAVKNLFGIIPGSYKAEYHLRFENPDDFADLLIDLCLFAKPVLHVMDAVVGMEGYGPTNGNPKPVNLIISSANPYALDVVASNIIGLQPGQVPSIRKSIERGLCAGGLGDIEISGESPENVGIFDFKTPTIQIAFNFYSILLPKILKKWLDRAIKPKPSFDHSVCTGCGMCYRSCPPKALQMKAGKPTLELKKCIRCFCCHELCNLNAIKIKRPWFIRILLH
jgi:uncharacterized protein (DUF362 family)/Pyruvate/2-oxoacid:ferredoxin oxidoreductase delta subunit